MTLFNEKAGKAANKDLATTRSNVLRTLFLGRILSLSLKDTKSLPLLDTKVKNEMDYILSALNTLDEHVRPLSIAPAYKWLNRNFNYDELTDVGGVIETFSQIQTDEDAKIYGAVARLYATLNTVRKRGKPVDTHKYLKFIELLTEELHAESTGGTTALMAVGEDVFFQANSATQITCTIVKPKAKEHG